MFTITLTGNLGSNPQVKNIGDDKVVCTLNIAVKDRDKTVWVTVEHWGKVATAHAKHLESGDKVLVIGTPKTDKDGKTRAWIGEDGEAHSRLEVIAQSVEYL